MGVWEKVLLPIGIGVGTAVVTLAGVAVHKLDKLSKKFDKSVSELEDSTVKDIQQTVVQKAVENAASTQVKDYLRDVHSVVMANARTELQKEAKAAVSDAKTVIQDQVTSKVSEEAAKIDIAEMRKEVREKAEEKVLGKFDDNLQDIMDRFAGNLSATYKTYSNFAEMMSKLNKNSDDGKARITIG